MGSTQDLSRHAGDAEVTQYYTAKRRRNKFNCAGDFTTTNKIESIGQLLYYFMGVSTHYKMPLHEQVLWMFRMNPDLASQYQSRPGRSGLGRNHFLVYDEKPFRFRTKLPVYDETIPVQE